MISINRRNPDFLKWCERNGVRPRMSDRVILDALWADLNRIADACVLVSPGGVNPPAPAPVVGMSAPIESDADRDALVAAYEGKFGKKPHHMMKAENIQKALDEQG